jgi:hypothetical protein
MTTLDPADLKRLQHMLGAVPGDHPKRLWGYRNYYASTPPGNAYESMRKMESLGLVTLGRVSESGMHFFHATVAGCKEAGLHAAAIKRAFED